MRTNARLPGVMTVEQGTFILLFDQTGSLRTVANASGQVIKEIEYDTFGNIVAETVPDFDIPFGFAGGLHDRATGLVRFGVRDYLPEVGRFMAKDPLGLGGGDPDVYGYCLDDPINRVDPSGMASSPLPDNPGPIRDRKNYLWNECTQHDNATACDATPDAEDAIIGNAAKTGRFLFDWLYKPGQKLKTK